MDIVGIEWVVEVNALLAQIVHFGKLRHGYFEINIRNGKVGGLLI